MQKTMTIDEFESLKPLLLRFTLKTVEIAKEVLVRNRSLHDVAKEYKISRQRVGAVVARVLAASESIPCGWKHVSVWLPPEVAVHVLELESEAKKSIIEKNK